MSASAVVSGLTSREGLYGLLDPDVMWYAAALDSNDTCNCAEDVIETIERGTGAGRTGHFEVVAERGELVVVRAVVDPPGPERDCALLLRRPRRAHRRDAQLLLTGGGTRLRGDRPIVTLAPPAPPAVFSSHMWMNRYRHVTPFAVASTASGAGGGSPKTDSIEERRLIASDTFSRHTARSEVSV
ncbi:MAG TPA: hypothetical protein VH063_15660 [Gaiellaceae bacterium]|nr:hypothetical protein [Gaiellaceae bacterium]